MQGKQFHRNRRPQSLLQALTEERDATLSLPGSLSVVFLLLRCCYYSKSKISELSGVKSVASWRPKPVQEDLV
jgi:hypothetical protein